MGENHFATEPVALYGFDLAMCAVAFTILERCLLKLHGPDSSFARALGRDFKGWLSLICYFVAVPLAFVTEWISVALYVFVAAMWLVPDRRFARQASHPGG
jgi:uncharacterized membrane protein